MKKELFAISKIAFLVSFFVLGLTVSYLRLHYDIQGVIFFGILSIPIIMVTYFPLLILLVLFLSKIFKNKIEAIYRWYTGQSVFKLLIIYLLFLMFGLIVGRLFML